MRLSEKPVLRLVLDTNILISALLRKNTPPYLLYQAWRENQFELVTSPEQLEEAQKMLAGITAYTLCVTSLPIVSDSPDPDDNIILATAIAGNADYFVSDDKSDLLKLGVIEDILIITARQALDILEQRIK